MQTEKRRPLTTNESTHAIMAILFTIAVGTTVCSVIIASSIGFTDDEALRQSRIIATATFLIIAIIAAFSLVPMYECCRRHQEEHGGPSEPVPLCKEDVIRRCTMKRDEMLARESTTVTGKIPFSTQVRDACGRGQPATTISFSSDLHEEYIEKRLEQFRKQGFRVTRKPELDEKYKRAYEVYWGYTDSDVCVTSEHTDSKSE